MVGPFIDWPKLLRRLSIGLVSDQPLGAICPKCRKGKLRINSDSYLPRYRFSCSQCDLTGDILRLVERMTKVPESASLAKLAELDSSLGGQYAGIAEQIRLNDRRHANVLAGIALACGNPLRINSAQKAVEILSQDSLRLPNLSYVPETVGPVLGYLSADELERLVRLERPDDKARPLPGNSYRILPVAAQGACVVPLWSAPGVPSGVYFFYHVGRERKDKSYNFKYAGEADYGIALHPQLLRSEEPLVLAPGMRNYVRMVVEHARKSSVPAPIASLPRLGEHTHLSINWINNRRLSLWTPRMVPEQLRQAIRLNCPIHVCGPKQRTTEAVTKYLKGRSISDLIAETHDKAIHWPEAMARMLFELPNDEASLFIQHCDLSGAELQLLEGSLAPSQRDLTRRTLDVAWQHAVIPVNRGNVEQNVKGWFFKQTRREPMCITNAPFRIQHIFNRAKKPTCTVQVSYEQQTYDVTADLQAFRKSPMSLIQQLMLEQHNKHTTFDPSWEKHVLHISSQISPPATISTEQHVGYNASQNVFRTTTLAIDTLTGRVTPTDSGQYGELLPHAKNRVLSLKELKVINFDPKTAWPVIVTAAQIFAAINRQRPIQLVLANRSAVRHMRQLAAVLGVSLADDDAVNYGMPKLKLMQEQYLTRRLFAGEDVDWSYPMWVAASLDVADWATMTANAFWIDQPYSRVPMPTSEGAQTAIVQLLSEMCRRSEQSKPALVASTQAWQVLCRRAEQTSCVTPTMLPSSNAVDGLRRMLQRHLKTGLMVLTSKRTEKTPLPNITYASGTGLFYVPRGSVSRLFDRLSLPLWDMDIFDLEIMRHPTFSGRGSQPLRPLWRMRRGFLNVDKPKVTKGPAEKLA